jgi:hypothetical protein
MRTCGRTSNERTGTPFNHLQVPTDIALLVVLWRLRDTLSLCDVAEMCLTRCFTLSWLRRRCSTAPWGVPVGRPTGPRSRARSRRRAALDDVPYAAAWASGHTLTLEQSVAHAVAGPRDEPAPPP